MLLVLIGVNVGAVIGVGVTLFVQWWLQHHPAKVADVLSNLPPMKAPHYRTGTAGGSGGQGQNFDCSGLIHDQANTSKAFKEASIALQAQMKIEQQYKAMLGTTPSSFIVDEIYKPPPEPVDTETIVHDAIKTLSERIEA